MKFLKHALALLITFACLYIAFHGVDLKEAVGTMFDSGRVRILPLVTFSGLSLGVLWVRGWRWKYFFLPEQQATAWGLSVSNTIGFMTNNILPLRIGEVVRALMARRKVKAPMSYILATLFIERTLDSMCLLFCLILPLASSRQFPPLVGEIGKGMFFVFAGALGLLIILRSKPHLAQKAALPLGRRFLPPHAYDRLELFMATFTEGLLILRNGRVMLKIGILSIFHWWLVAVSYDLAFRSFSLQEGLPWTAPYLTLGLVGLGVALPSAPAFVGPVHAAIIYSLNRVYDVPRVTATGFAVVMHLLMMAPVTVAGLALMWQEGLTLGQIRQRADHLEENQPSPVEDLSG